MLQVAGSSLIGAEGGGWVDGGEAQGGEGGGQEGYGGEGEDDGEESGWVVDRDAVEETVHDAEDGGAGEEAEEEAKG